MQPDLDVDLRIAPMLNKTGRVRLEAKPYALEYEMKENSFSLTNLLDRQRTFLLCMDGKQKKVALGAGESLVWDMTEG